MSSPKLTNCVTMCPKRPKLSVPPKMKPNDKENIHYRETTHTKKFTQTVTHDVNKNLISRTTITEEVRKEKVLAGPKHIAHETCAKSLPRICVNSIDKRAPLSEIKPSCSRAVKPVPRPIKSGPIVSAEVKFRKSPALSKSCKCLSSNSTTLPVESNRTKSLHATTLSSDSFHSRSLQPKSTSQTNKSKLLIDKDSTLERPVPIVSKCKCARKIDLTSTRIHNNCSKTDLSTSIISGSLASKSQHTIKSNTLVNLKLSQREFLSSTRLDDNSILQQSIPLISELNKSAGSQNSTRNPSLTIFRVSNKDNSATRNSSYDDTWITLHTLSEDLVMKGAPYKESNKLVRVKNFTFDFINHSSSKVIHEGIPSLRKKTLRKNVLQPSCHRGTVNLDPHTNKVHLSLLYSDYMEDFIQYVLYKEKYFVLQNDFGSVCRPRVRSAVVHWLLKFQQFMGSDLTVLFSGIRILDRILHLSDVKSEHVQLVAVTSYWVACKYGDIIEYPKAPTILKLCDYVYSLDDLKRTERKILEILKFNVAVEEPLTLARYYIFKMKVPDGDLVSHSASYLLECLSLEVDFNTYYLSLQAAAAVHLSMLYLGADMGLWGRLKSCLGYYSPDQLRPIEKKMQSIILSVQNPESEFHGPYCKYSTDRYGAVSTKIFKFLTLS